MSLGLVYSKGREILDGQLVKCRFRFLNRHGRGSNRRAVYVCVAHAFPSGCLPFATKVTKVPK